VEELDLLERPMRGGKYLQSKKSLAGIMLSMNFRMAPVVRITAKEADLNSLYSTKDKRLRLEKESAEERS
jgi:hypothetical protein